ncbi:Glycosyl transferases group 1 [Paenibacillus sp. UNCCL117]|uniref:glycosyltransferase family 4 protein n=1 Tax=unclassified Paenibacillus TaxID=185978 RepID=UPI000888C49C|nr:MULTISPECIES: glycosyltransferase family 4 protein [unclassified Paenibacillus]SDD30291.1 Glycosyl transferases group 1 [Paenibacillus sp. cl123]SFW40372.1 Glycosyl transferases group 1 [Paenibacillus sp. UNCCL117]
MITGAEKYLLLLARELGQYAECTLVAPESGLLAQEAEAAGIRTVIHEVPLVWQMFNPGPDLRQEVEARLDRGEHERLVNLLHMHQPDLVVVNTCLNVFPAAAARVAGVPVAWFVTEKITENAWTSQTVSLMNSYADWIVGISETTLRPIRMHSQAAGAKAHLLPPTWRLEELRPEEWPYHRELRRLELGIRAGERLIGYISSSLHEEKGLEHFVTMAAEVALRRPHTRFLIVGNVTDEAYFTRCSNQIRATGCGARFQWRSFEPRIERLFPALDMLVVPSLIDEGFGLTAAEGLLFGADVVAYRAGGLEEIMLAVGHGAWLADKGDAAGLADRVLELLDSDAAGAEGRRQAGRASLEAAYGIEAYRRRLRPLAERFYDESKQRSVGRAASPGRDLDPGWLYKGERSAAVFLLESGMKRPFATEETMRFYRYRWEEVRVVPDAWLYALPTGPEIRHTPPSAGNRPAILLAKGSGPRVYLIAHGRRFPFASQAALRQRGYTPERVVELPDSELDLLPLGEALRSSRTRTRALSRKLRKSGRRRKLKLRRRPLRKLPLKARRKPGGKRLLRRRKRHSAGRKRLRGTRRHHTRGHRRPAASARVTRRARRRHRRRSG